VGGYISEVTASNGFSSYGGFQANSAGTATGPYAFEIAGTKVVDLSDNGFFASLTITGITGSTQCLQINNVGLISGTGSACGSSGGGSTAPEFTATNTSGYTFVNSNSNFQVAASGAIYSASTATNAINVPNGTIQSLYFNATGTAANSINTSGGFRANGANAYSVGSTVVITNGNGGTFTGPGGVVSSGAGQFTDGIDTGSASSSTLYIGTSGNFYNRPLGAASTTISCSGIANGWTTVTTDNYIVVCDNGGTRYRATLSSF
jgi:hypothetical protein